MNDENLISLADRPERERKEIQSKGGLATSAKNKQKKLMREVVQEVMKMNMTPDMVEMLKEKFPFLEDGMNYQTAMVLGQVKSAIDGNSKAFELLSTMNDAENGNKANDYEQELSVDELRGLLDGTKSSNNPKD